MGALGDRGPGVLFAAASQNWACKPGATWGGPPVQALGPSLLCPGQGTSVWPSSYFAPLHCEGEQQVLPRLWDVQGGHRMFSPWLLGNPHSLGDLLRFPAGTGGSAVSQGFHSQKV